ncbi:ATP-binding cassette domain-containing protein [Massilia sp. CF038]|uniref:ATP-binding cassette domain-containing protein n=2 Tax=Pseudomonadota TaxID=1224 RepID=UPI0009241A08|nr:ATP-binding cassette domain-containing protein [Massilia sp. CF038]SHH62755.1 macrolide transport system ATP-binding/permease protein [Massilia sp. CF038]
MPLLSLHHVVQRFKVGQDPIVVLNDVTLSIHRGEFVAIVGPSGSGKSTLLNVLGCLARPSAGTYRIAGEETSSMGADALARIRSTHIGFVFQRYNLLPQLSALENVALPALYAGAPKADRNARAQTLLTQFGLDQRLDHRPAQLSGGQQQRVCVARALINDAEVILADEPTGALDSENGQALLDLLRRLHEAGRTIVLVTHDLDVAAVAERTIQMKDGIIVHDSGTPARYLAGDTMPAGPHAGARLPRSYALVGQGLAALTVALRSMVGKRLRSALTMLGVFIGTAAVVTSVAVSQSAKTEITKNLNKLSRSALEIKRGLTWNDPAAASIVSLTASDLPALSRLPVIASAVPMVETTARMRYRHKDTDGFVMGTGSGGVAAAGMNTADGRDLSESDIAQARNVVFIDANAKHELFGHDEPLGAQLVIGEVPFTVIGVGKKGLYDDGKPVVWVPHSSLLQRILGRNFYDGIRVYFRDGSTPEQVEQQVTAVMTGLHGRKDFHVTNTAAFWQEMEQVTMIAALAFGLLAAISLLVGGIGVMNIMLVAVVERTQEIGVRMAIGARQSDIGRQFLTESVLLCVMGGAAGLVLAAVFCAVIGMATDKLHPAITLTSGLVAFFTCTVIGMLFGWFPARHAARLDPILALSRE